MSQFFYPCNLQNKEFSADDAFYIELRSRTILESENSDYGKPWEKRLTLQQVFILLKLSKPPPTVVEDYHYLQQTKKRD